jgi:signal transduction histidine kinase
MLFAMICFSLTGKCGEIDSLKQKARVEVDKRELGKIHSRLGWLHIVSDPTAAENYIDTAIQNYRAIGDSAGIANSWYRYGVLYRFTGDFDRADSLMDLNLSFYSARADTFNIVNALFQKGVIYSLQGRYDRSLEAYFDILEVYESLGDSTSMGFTLNSIGIVFKNMRKFDDAESVLKRSISIHRSLGDQSNMANALGNLGSVYAESGDHERAISFFRKAGNIDMELGILWGVALNEMNEGTAYLNLNRYNEALPHLQRAREIQSSNGYTADLAENMAKLGKVLVKLGQADSAEAAIRAGLALNVSSNTTMMELYEALSEVLEAKGAYPESLEAKKMQAAYQDSIFNETNARMANVWAAEYGVKEKEVQLSRKDELLEEQDSLIEQMKSRTSLAVGGALLALVVAFLTWIFYRQQQRLKNQDIENLRRQKEIAALESYINGEENERKRIAQDLHDGLNGDLSVVKYKVSSLEEHDSSPIFEKHRREAIELIDKACAQVRAISHNLAPQMLEEFSLREAVDQYVARLNSGSDIRFAFQYFGDSPDLGQEKETVIFRMIQEMANNIIKHSGATDALVQFNRHDNDLVITVEDNGRGFDTDAVPSGLGLRTIFSRVDYLNAECDLTSNAEGTTYIIHVPIAKSVPA